MPSKRYKKALELVDGKKPYPLKVGGGSLGEVPEGEIQRDAWISPFVWEWIPSNRTRWSAARSRCPMAAAKPVRVLVFAKSGPAADAAKAAGAEYVGFDDMIKKCQEGWTDFDVAIATPEAMAEVRKLGKVLGPRGLDAQPENRNRDR